MSNKLKIFGLFIAVAIMGLSLENALTGHGIKGNKNLNPEVLANSTGTGTGTGKGTGTGTAGSKYNVITDTPEVKMNNYYKEGDETCCNYTIFFNVDCAPNGSSNCFPGRAAVEGVSCFEIE